MITAVWKSTQILWHHFETEQASPGRLVGGKGCVCVCVWQESFCVWNEELTYVCVLCKRWVEAVRSSSLSGQIWHTFSSGIQHAITLTSHVTIDFFPPVISTLCFVLKYCPVCCTWVYVLCMAWDSDEWHTARCSLGCIKTMIHEQFKVQNCGENVKNVRVDGGCGRSNEKTLTSCFMSHLYKQIWMQNL